MLSDYSTSADYASGAKSATVTAAEKWAKICELHSLANPSAAASIRAEGEGKVGSIVLIALAILAFGFTAFFALKRSRANK